jgi:putative tryptophan/tyrosine transport system substrate-binding protein
MRRRAFIAGLGSAAAWPLMARAQQSAMPVIGFLSARSPNGAEALVAAYKEGLAETGYVSDQNIAIDYRWAEGRYDLLPALAADLVSRRVALIAAFGGNLPILAAKGATTTIPIVFTTGSDPISTGLVASINRPTGNATGVYMFSGGLEAKRLALLRELVPSAAVIIVLANPTAGAGAEPALNDLQAAAVNAGAQIQIVYARNPAELDSAFAAIGHLASKALLVVADPFLNSERDRLIYLAARYAIPAIYDLRDFVLAGGLMSYGTSLTSAYRQVGIYSGRILKGAKPADLPIVQSTKFEFAINLNTAKALGIEVPPGLSARADEVIE